MRKEPEAFLYAVQVGFLAPYALEISLAMGIAGIACFSIVVGELTSKIIAQGNAEIITFIAAILCLFSDRTLKTPKVFKSAFQVKHGRRTKALVLSAPNALVFIAGFSAGKDSVLHAHSAIVFFLLQKSYICRHNPHLTGYENVCLPEIAIFFMR